ncbi:MAG: acyl-CoA synthetase [Pseudomonadota bacterium]
MHPSQQAVSQPDTPAVIMADTGKQLTYRELDALSNRIAHWFRSLGLAPRDHIAILLENCLEYMPIIWAAQRSGLVYTAISTHLLHDEVAYIVANSRSRLLITSDMFAELAASVRDASPKLEFATMLHANTDAFDDFESVIAAHPETPIDDEEAGVQMLYSSGTTGRPKGVLSLRPNGTPIDEILPMPLALVSTFGIGAGTVYLSPAPLYHAAPLTFCTVAQALGATIVIMPKFDPELALASIARFGVTHSQWVPIMFVRMLKLPEDVRKGYDLSSLQVAIHAAAPCPVDIKQRMIEWWGPRLAEYYASTEGAGFTAIDSANWLTHKGSVGQPVNCQVHIVGDDGEPVPTGEVGTVYFSGNPQKFEYFDEPEKTAQSYKGDWATVGDVGYVDDEGFLYLTDRKHYMIISGGVNIYPQEVEDLLVSHDQVADAAVFGLPDPEFGERVHAVVQPLDGTTGGDALEAELIGYLRKRLSHIKVPRSIDFDAALPRHDNGKLYKRRLVERYKATAAS